MKKLFTLLMITLLVTNALMAQYFEVDGINYKITSSKEPYTVEVRGKTPQYEGDIIIPTQVTHDSISYSVTAIGYSAFSECNELKSVTIPNSVTIIKEYSFYYCTGLNHISIPKSVISIEFWAFHYCTGLLSIDVDFENPNYLSIDGILHTKDTATLIQCPGGKTDSVTIVNSVTKIGEFAFSGCAGLTSVIIGNSVTSIERAAFSGCEKLTSILLPNSVTKIEESAFHHCQGLHSVIIPKTVTSIGRDAFHFCKGLTSIDVHIENKYYLSIDGILHTKDTTTLIKCPGGKTGSVTIDNSVTKIEMFAFSNCEELTSITIGNSVTSIEYAAIEFCTGLTLIKIPNSVTTIKAQSFGYCSELTSVSIGNAVSFIGYHAFAFCTGLTSITCYADTPPALEDSVFMRVPKTIPLFVPMSSVSLYQNADQWKDFIITGISDIHEDQVAPLSIYPNPFCEEININIADFSKISFELYDISGKVILSREINEDTQIPLHDLTSGIYFYNMINTNGRRQYGKLIKE